MLPSMQVIMTENFDNGASVSISETLDGGKYIISFRIAFI